MKSIQLIFLLSGMCLAQVAFSQIPVRYQNYGSGYIFSQEGKRLTPKEMLSIYKVNDDAYGYMKKAQGSLAAGQVFGYGGGFLVGWPVGSLLAGGEPNWTLAAIGAPLAIISIPFFKKWAYYSVKATDTYNRSLEELPDQVFRMEFGPGRYGYGLVLTF